jgi:CHAT domain-containing protein
MIEARAAANGGDYGRARVALGEVDRERLSANERERVTVLDAVWRCLTLLAPGDVEIKSMGDSRMKCAVELFKGARPTSDVARSLRERGGNLLMHVGNLRSVAGGPEGELQAKLVELGMATALKVGCGSERACAMGAVLQVRLLKAAHKVALARKLVDEAITKPVGDDRQVGLLVMTQGDLLVAPEGEPEDLGLPLSNVRSDLARRAGQTASQASMTANAIQAARDAYQDAARRFGSGNCPRCLIDLDVREAYLAFLEQRWDDARAGFARARRAFIELGDPAGATRLDFPLLGLALKADDARTVERLVAEATRELKPAERAPRAAALVTLLLAFSSAQRDAGSLAVALSADKAARDIAMAVGTPAVRREALSQRCGLLNDLGLRREALPDLRLLLDLPGAEPAQRLQDAMALMGAYLALEDAENAKKVGEQICPDCKDLKVLLVAHRYQEVVALAHAKGDRLWEAAARLGMNDISGAAPLIQAEAQELLARLEHKSETLLEDLRALLANDEILARVFPSVEQVRRLGLPDAAVRALLAQGLRGRLQSLLLLALNARQFQTASSLVAKADKYFPTSILVEPEKPWAELGARASLAEGLGDLRTARELGDRAVAMVDHLTTLEWSNSAEENLRDSVGYLFSDSTRARIELALAGQISAGEALLFLEDWRARRFYARLQRSAVAATTSHTAFTKHLREMAELEMEVADLHRELAQVDSQKQDSPRRARLEQLEARRLALAAKASDAWGAAGDVKSTELLTRLRDGTHAGGNTAFLIYFADRDLVVAWVVDGAGTVSLRRLPSTSFELGELVLKLRNTIQQNALRPDDDTWRAPARSLYAKLIAPIEDLLPPGGTDSRLGIVPFGSLHGLPFSALLQQETPLVQRYAIFHPPGLHAYSILRDLARARSQSAGSTRIVSFGYNGTRLSDAEREAMSLARGRDAHFGKTANRSDFERAVAGGGVLHVAAHAEYDASDPFASAIWLHDGPVRMLDLPAMNMTTRLITLSACDTGRSEISRGEDLSGMSWAILAAGVPSVVVAGWRVDDQLSLPLMRTFYTSLRQGRDPAVALANAQRSAAASSGQSAAWAVFSLMGAD